MAQICVVNCYSCETFQGQQVKKGKRWICKMCGEKQSFKKIFAQGSGKECRQVVQKLNMISGNLKCQMLQETCLQECGNNVAAARNENNNQDQTYQMNVNSKSKWNQFVSSATADASETLEEQGENVYTTEREIFEKQKAPKQKKAMREITADHFQEYEQRKMQKSSHRETTFSHSKAGQSYTKGNLDFTENDVPTTNEKSSQRQAQRSATSTVAVGPTKLSKWSKFT